MWQKFRSRIWVLWAIAMLLLILDSKTVLAGGQAGIALCIQSVVPALFPFLVLSPIFTSELCRKRFRFLAPVEKILKLPVGGQALLITGFLGGYPVGAQCIAQSVSTGQISRESGRRMMRFCCNCGPGFVFGICGRYFSSPRSPWALWAIHILAALLVGTLLSGIEESFNGNPGTPKSLTQALPAAVRAMAQICGWVVLFRCGLEFANKWFLQDLCAPFQVLCGGILELTNGCCSLGSISNEDLRFILCEAMLSFGGLCVAMQTASVAGELGLRPYLSGKLLQTVFSVILAAAYCAAMRSMALYCLYFILFLALTWGVCRRLLKKKKKISGKFQPVGI